VQTPEAKAAYDARWQRIMDCVQLKQPGMPTALFCTFWLAKFGGITHRLTNSISSSTTWIVCLNNCWANRSIK